MTLLLFEYYIRRSACAPIFEALIPLVCWQNDIFECVNCSFW
ncbi:unnamed protein product [Acanthoscelides obtectus]|uniref:Uncharacterized protein n=1 Tax=Acanthoscelides obtectus TaxID=200917 RepID=A0A9P0LP51_ACAOB|nr:unnamed protein product [Acanthoscelides obtectus]CAK1625631.1 hypothetical protein AOBTE_LOCUS3288 [Acanthoscelides obtectus]